VALQAVERDARDVTALVRAAGSGPSVLPPAADPYFVLERVALDGEAALASGFAVLVVLTGEAAVTGGPVLRAGSTAVAPYTAGPLVLRGRADVLLCRPPVAG
jgi:mannose-6-phosphate isomerase